MYLFFLAGILLFSACDKAEFETAIAEDSELKSAKMVMNFRAHLSGKEVLINPETDGTGQALFQVSKDGTELHYKVILANIENVTMAHIHLAPAGTNGPVVVWLYPAAPPAVLLPGRTDGIVAEGVIKQSDLRGLLAGQPFSKLIEEIAAGNTYVNVHTSQYPTGEIRGQIR